MSKVFFKNSPCSLYICANKIKATITTTDLIGDVYSSVEEDGTQECLEAVGHGVPEFRVVAKVRPVGEQDILLQT